MPRRQLKLPEPANPLDPGIREAMVTEELPALPDFEGYVSADDISDFGTRDRKTVLAMSVQGQYIDWLIETLIESHRQLRQVDAEVARQKIELAKMKSETQEQRMLWKLLRASALIVGAGALSALGQWLLKGR